MGRIHRLGARLCVVRRGGAGGDEGCVGAPWVWESSAPHSYPWHHACPSLPLPAADCRAHALSSDAVPTPCTARPFILHYPRDRVGVVDEVCMLHPHSAEGKQGEGR